LSVSSAGGAIAVADTFNGNIALSVPGTTALSLNIDATDPASGISGATPVTVAAAVLKSGTGGINFVGANSISAPVLAANSTGIVAIDDTYNGSISLQNSS